MENGKWKIKQKTSTLAPSPLAGEGRISERETSSRNSGEGYIKAVIVTSPSYEGVVTDIKKIKEITFKGAKLISFNVAGGNFVQYKILVEDALATGELKSNGYTSDEALAALKKAKDKLDLGLIKPKRWRIRKVTQLLKFSKYESDWFCVYDNRYIRQWKGESVSKDKIVPMRRYLDEVFNPDKVINIINRYDMRNFMYCDIMSQALFATQLKLIKAK